MNSFELNKVLGAMLGTCLVLLALNIGAGAIFAPEKPAKPGYNIAVKEERRREEQAKEKEEPIAMLLAKASVEKGQAAAKQCQACHTFEKGGPNRVGPNLYGIVGRERGKHPGFNYLGGDEGQRRQMDLRRAQQIPRRSARLHPRHRHDLRGSHPRHSSAPTSSITCTRCRITRCRCPRRRRRTKPNRTRQAGEATRSKPAKPSRPKPNRRAKPPAKRAGRPRRAPRPLRGEVNGESFEYAQTAGLARPFCSGCTRL